MRFEPDNPAHALIKSVPHITFEVDDLQSAIAGKQILTEPKSPSEGVMVAMILDGGAPVELLEFRRDAGDGSKRRDPRRNAGLRELSLSAVQRTDWYFCQYFKLQWDLIRDDWIS